MGPKKSRRNLRKNEIPTDTSTEFEFGDTAGYSQMRMEDREEGEREK